MATTLEAREVFSLVVKDVVNEDDEGKTEIDERTKKQISAAKAITIQDLGDLPLRLCLSVKQNPENVD